MLKRCILVVVLMLGWAGASVAADRITVAVATNFLVPVQDIAAAFSAETGHDVALVHGSTGKLYAQIIAGAPFDIFLSADAARPARLVDQNLALSETLKPYAIGRLALVHGASTPPGLLDEILSRPLRIAIADPAIAPYGVAARDVLQRFRGTDWDRDLVYGESVGQAFAFVATGNADLGLVALSQALTSPAELFMLEIPSQLHAPIRQDAVLLNRAANTVAARAFLDYLDGPFAIQSLTNAGYDVPE